MEWRREDVVSLINLYREQRVLWDASHPDFRIRPRKHEAWMVIASVMNTPKAEVESKMRKLAGQFYREEKRCNSGAGESKWFAYNLLLFLRDKRQQQLHPTDGAAGSTDDIYQGNLSGCSLDHFREAEDSGGEAYEYDLQGHEAQLSRDTSIASELEVEPFSRLKRKAELPFPPQTQTKRIMKPALGIDEEDMMTWSNYRDEFDVFGENVAFTIRKLKSTYAKIIVKHEINNILFKAEMGVFDSPRGHQPLSAGSPAAASGSPTPASPPN